MVEISSEGGMTVPVFGVLVIDECSSPILLSASSIPPPELPLSLDCVRVARGARNVLDPMVLLLLVGNDGSSVSGDSPPSSARGADNKNAFFASRFEFLRLLSSLRNAARFVSAPSNFSSSSSSASSAAESLSTSADFETGTECDRD